MKRAYVALSFLLISLCFTACKPGRSLVGNWKSDSSPVPGLVQTIEFKGDKSALMSLKGSAAGFTVDAKIKANYDLQGEKLSFTVTEMDLGEIGKMAPSGTIEKMKGEIGKRNSGTLQWENDDKITMVTSDGTSMVYSRIKN